MKISWLGTGVMGCPMARHLLEAGYELTIFTRTKSKASKLLKYEGKWTRNPFVSAKEADIVCAMVGYPADGAWASPIWIDL